MRNSSKSNYRWYILALAALTNAFAVGMPRMCLPVLFKEISEDLSLSLLQIGIVWGMISLGGLSVSLVGGLLADRFGVKRTLSIACFLAGLSGALRGLSGDFISLTATVFLFGLLTWIIPVSLVKITGIWFAGRNLGVANGVLSMGMGIGFMVGAMISATILSPLLGGWRNVLFLYGAISAAIGIFWFLTGREPTRVESPASYTSMIPFRQALSRIVRVRGIWLLGLTLLGYSGCLEGVTGYLPIYLRERGYTAASADGTLAALSAISITAAIPLTLLSDRIGLRKVVILPAILVTITGVGLLSVAPDTMLWGLAIMAGIAREAFMALTVTMLVETEGVGVTYVGTALGLILSFARLGSFISPPLGNSLADINLGLPFVFWAALAVVALFGFCFIKETGRRQRIRMLRELDKESSAT